jgi:hypothetical protein
MTHRRGRGVGDFRTVSLMPVALTLGVVRRSSGVAAQRRQQLRAADEAVAQRVLEHRGSLLLGILCVFTIERMFRWVGEVAGWARSFGVHPQTAYRWFREDRMPVPGRRLPVGDDRGRGVSG